MVTTEPKSFRGINYQKEKISGKRLINDRNGLFIKTGTAYSLIARDYNPSDRIIKSTIEWECLICSAYNPLLDSKCHACGKILSRCV